MTDAIFAVLVSAGLGLCLQLAAQRTQRQPAQNRQARKATAWRTWNA
ncbi:hypothetical protein [Aliishimia ponticola]|nr:hypothetical protein [Aliishimia ponticola]